MRNIYHSVNAILIMACSAALALAQPAAKTTTAVPRLVKFGGTLTDAGGKPLSGVVGVTFALYQEPEGGAAIWIWTRQETPGESGVPDESLPVILLRSSCCYQFFSMSSEVGD